MKRNSGPASSSSTGVTPSNSVLLRSTDGNEHIQWLDREGVLHGSPPSPRLREEDFSSNSPIRVGPEYQNRVNRHGFYYWQRTTSHVWYESALEAESLVLLDFRGEVARIASQPFRILFGDDSACVRHDPDFFAVHHNGDLVVYDVKPSGRMTDEVRAQLRETARVCSDVGWRHVVVNELPDPFIRNLELLRSARHPRCHPDGELQERILAAFAGGLPLQEGREALDPRHPALVMPYIHHLLWHGYLTVDLDTPLSLSKEVSTTRKGSACCAQ